MPTNKEIGDRILAALQNKTGHHQVVCPICGGESWTLLDRYAPLPLSGNAIQFTIGPKILPLIPLYCEKCGNTQLINMMVLGFKEEDLKSLMFSEDVKE